MIMVQTMPCNFSKSQYIKCMGDNAVNYKSASFYFTTSIEFGLEGVGCVSGGGHDLLLRAILR